MTEMSRPAGYAALLAIGTCWAATLVLTKIAVSTGHGHFGLIFWQLVISALALGLLMVLTGRRVLLTRAAIWTAIVIGVVGTIAPNSTSYQAYVHLPVGIMAILISLVPMAAFPIALVMGNEGFSLKRLGGLAMGLLGVVLIVAPKASLPDPSVLVWVPVAIIAPVLYAFEANYVSKYGTAGMDPLQTLFSASVVGAVLVLPLALHGDHWIDPLGPWGRAEWALVASAVLHAAAYTGYVWLVGRTGSVFAAQVAYVVTGTTVVLAMVFLGERYALTVWLALAVMLAGLALVQPRRPAPLAPAPGLRKNET